MGNPTQKRGMAVVEPVILDEVPSGVPPAATVAPVAPAAPSAGAAASAGAGPVQAQTVPVVRTADGTFLVADKATDQKLYRAIAAAEGAGWQERADAHRGLNTIIRSGNGGNIPHFATGGKTKGGKEELISIAHGFYGDEAQKLGIRGVEWGSAPVEKVETALNFLADSIPDGYVPVNMTKRNVVDHIVANQFEGDPVAFINGALSANSILQQRQASLASRMTGAVNAIHGSPELQEMTGLYPRAARGGGGGGGGGAGYWNEPSATFADLPVINDALADWKRRDLAIAGGLAAAGLGAGGLFLANYLGDRPAEIDPALAMAMAQSNQQRGA